MPKPHKRDILGETWEYTLLADDFSSFDEDAKGITPAAATMSWRGCSYPTVANEISPSIKKDGSSGPWWLPDDTIWEDDRLLLNILQKAYFMESIPVVKDTLLVGCTDIEIIRREQIFIPSESGSPVKTYRDGALRQAICKLIMCGASEKECAFAELISAFKSDELAKENAFRINLYLVKFPYRIWVEGLSHMRIHPIIVIPTDIYRRYHH